jgi:hypothetical protein
LPGRDANQLQGELDIFKCRQCGQQMKELKHGAHAATSDPREGVAGKPFECFAVQGDRARIRTIHAAQAVQQVVLPLPDGPVRASRWPA